MSSEQKYQPTDREKLIEMQLSYIIGEIRFRARNPNDAWAVEFLTDLKWKIKTGEPLI